MPFGVVTAPAAAGAPSAYGAISVQIGSVTLTSFRSFRFTQHFLTPTDSFSFELSTDVMTDEVLDAVFTPGVKLTFFIDDAKQFTGYIDVVDTSNAGRHEGSSITIEGRDAMSPVIDSQIDPDHHYPDNTPLDKLLRDTLAPWFEKFDITNEANIDVAAGKAARAKLKRRTKRKSKALSQYPIPKSKPEHNDSFFVFLSRITQRYGLWIWPSVDGDTAIVGKPNFDQEPCCQLRRRRQQTVAGFGRAMGAPPSDGSNNIVRGGIRRDSSEQPSFIVARGNVPPKTVEHQRIKVIIGNPYDNVLERLIGSPPADPTGPVDLNSLGNAENIRPFFDAQPNPRPNAVSADDAIKNILVGSKIIEDPSLTSAHETGTSNSLLARKQFLTVTDVEVIPVKPIQIQNVYASLTARPRYLKDRHSRTLEELERFARRQMSLCTRKAFVGNYEIAGFKIDDAIPVVDTVVEVDDELSRFKGLLWVEGREVTLSRSGGATCRLSLIPLFSIQF